MIDVKELKVGLQVVHIPYYTREYCKGVVWRMLKHPDTEFGFVSSWRTEDDHSKTVFCRFWSKHSPALLRTLSTSEACDDLDLEVHDSRSPDVMRDVLAMLREDPNEYDWREQKDRELSISEQFFEAGNAFIAGFQTGIARKKDGQKDL